MTRRRVVAEKEHSPQVPLAKPEMGRKEVNREECERGEVKRLIWMRIRYRSIIGSTREEGNEE